MYPSKVYLYKVYDDCDNVYLFDSFTITPISLYACVTV
jgi:hypothetical protein